LGTARLSAVRLPPDKVQTSKARILNDNRRKGRVVQPKTLEAANHVLLLTSLDPDEYPAERVGALYRLRWQVELAFKRLKSLLHLDALRAKDPELARVWIFTNLLAAFMIDDMVQHMLDYPPEPTDQPFRHISLWRIVKMLIHSLRAAIIGAVSLDTYYARLNIAGHRLNEPPRRRTPQMVQSLS
jgi:hypothetical protein